MLKIVPLFVAAFVLSSAVTVSAAEKDSVIVVTVGEMCGGCVKKVTAKLQPMPEVANVECDIATKTVTVTPSAQSLSSGVLWDAQDSIGKTPKKTVTSEGTFSEKPKN